MSTASRLISGSVASWAQIGISIICQIALVPLYLSFWNVQTYGIWLAIQALITVLTTLDRGYQNYLGYEFLRSGREDREKLALDLWSGVWIAIAIGIFQLFIIVIFLALGILPLLLGDTTSSAKALSNEAGTVLLVQGVAWLITGSVGGLLTRALAPFGYYPRMAWWNVFVAVVTTATPVVAVTLGAGLLMTGIASAFATVACSIPVFLDMFRLIKKEKIHYKSSSIRLGLSNFFKSLAISGRDLLENVRQQGVRLVLSPLSGAVNMATFSTMRTGANVALQGLNTIVNPLMPELMRFIHQRDKPRIEVAFGTVWVVLIALLAPGVVLLQAFVEPLYFIWTRGQIPFNPLLFALLSLSVLVYAVAQPAVAVVRGNNLLRPQLILSAMAAIVVVGVMYVLVPAIGILGAGIALLAAEIVATISYGIVAKRWMSQNDLPWPERPFLIAVTSILIATAAISALIYLPGPKWIVLLLSALAFVSNLCYYWQFLPSLATLRVKKIIIELPFIRRLFVA